MYGGGLFFDQFAPRPYYAHSIALQATLRVCALSCSEQQSTHTGWGGLHSTTHWFFIYFTYMYIIVL